MIAQLGKVVVRLLDRMARRTGPAPAGLADDLMSALRAAERLWDSEYHLTAPPTTAGRSTFDAWLDTRALDPELAIRLRERWELARSQGERVAATQVGKATKSTRAQPDRTPSRFTVLAAKPDAYEPRQLHLLVNRIPAPEELTFRQVGAVTIAEQDGYILHFAGDLPGVYLEGRASRLWRVSAEDGGWRAVFGPGVGGAAAVNRVRPELGAVDVTLGTDPVAYETDRPTGRTAGTITSWLLAELHARFPDLRRDQRRAVADHAARLQAGAASLLRTASATRPTTIPALTSRQRGRPIR